MAKPCGELLSPTETFRLGETVNVHIEWDDMNKAFHRPKRFQITGFQMNGHVESARGFWKGEFAKRLTENYGIIFPLLDLKKIP